MTGYERRIYMQSQENGAIIDKDYNEESGIIYYRPFIYGADTKLWRRSRGISWTRTLDNIWKKWFRAKN